MVLFCFLLWHPPFRKQTRQWSHLFGKRWTRKNRLSKEQKQVLQSPFLQLLGQLHGYWGKEPGSPVCSLRLANQYLACFTWKGVVMVRCGQTNECTLWPFYSQFWDFLIHSVHILHSQCPRHLAKCREYKDEWDSVCSQRALGVEREVGKYSVYWTSSESWAEGAQGEPGSVREGFLGEVSSEQNLEARWELRKRVVELSKN